MRTVSGMYYETGYKNHNGVSIEHTDSVEKAIEKCVYGWAYQRNMGYENHEQVVFCNIWSRTFSDDDILINDTHNISFVQELKVNDYEEQIQEYITKWESILK